MRERGEGEGKERGRKGGREKRPEGGDRNGAKRGLKREREEEEEEVRARGDMHAEEKEGRKWRSLTILVLLQKGEENVQS